MSAGYASNQSVENFNNAWDIYHNSFKENETEMVRTISDAFIFNFKFLSPRHLDSCVRLLKELGRETEAKELIEFYMQGRAEEKEFFDLTRYTAGIGDPDVRAALSQRFASFVDQRSPVDVLAKIGQSDGWGSEDIALLSKLTEADFEQIFRNQDSAQLTDIIRAALKFGEVQGAPDDWARISSNARKALEKIGKESRLNTLRVKKFGISTPK